MSIPPLDGIVCRVVATPRLNIAVRTTGPKPSDPAVQPVVFIHGNLTSSVFWEEQMLRLPSDKFWAVAPDMRGFGDTDDLPIDATKGLGDWSDDLAALLDALSIGSAHVAGWSLGGGFVYDFAGRYPARVRSVILVAPASPFGFGGTKDAAGAPCRSDDFAGSGAGAASKDFADRIAAGDRTAESKMSPSEVMNAFFWKPPFVPARVDAFLSSVLATKCGPERYPGDSVPSEHFPGTAPGVFGSLNALSPKYCSAAVPRFVESAGAAKLRVLWVRGTNDAVVSDTSLFDVGFLGRLGAVPGWPGDAAHPPQPMVAQTRAVLESLRAAGGQFAELSYDNCGHAPFLEHADAFHADLVAHLEGRTARTVEAVAAAPETDA